MQLKNSFLPGRWTPSSVLATLAATLGLCAAGPVAAQVIQNPPSMPQNVIVFP